MIVVVVVVVVVVVAVLVVVVVVVVVVAAAAAVECCCFLINNYCWMVVTALPLVLPHETVTFLKNSPIRYAKRCPTDPGPFVVVARARISAAFFVRRRGGSCAGHRLAEAKRLFSHV